ncbi:MAG: ABC transporter ATP-binding protein [Alphaproteobacteria bacterium]|nr:ABC transporter ATP-binding protein [Alphaproteobacteria bacterium]
MSQAILEVRSLALGYGRMEVIPEVSLSLMQGELLVVIGANGAGKTTLLKGISGLLRRSRGTIWLEGVDVTGLAVHRLARAGIALVPEGRQIFGSLTVLDNLRLGGFWQSRASFSRGLERVMASFPILAERRDGLAGYLSGGEQQMLAIGRALMSQPKIMLLDEPSMGLAPQIVALIFAMIAELRSSGMSILLVEQNARLALEMADRGLVLESGRIAKSGSGRELAADTAIAEFYLGAGSG